MRITNTPSTGAAISPDGTTIVSWYKQDTKSHWQIALIPFEGGPPKKILNIERTSGRTRPRWTPDGLAISYVDTREGVSNIWIQPINGESPKQLTQFNSDVIEGFDWSPTGDLICTRSHYAQDIVRIDNFR